MPEALPECFGEYGYGAGERGDFHCAACRHLDYCVRETELLTGTTAGCAGFLNVYLDNISRGLETRAGSERPSNIIPFPADRLRRLK